jgi:hypothetical protein
LVTGQLIADVTPLPAGANPAAGAAGASSGAPATGGNSTATPLGVLAATAVIILLLGLGAGRELRWRRSASPLSS